MTSTLTATPDSPALDVEVSDELAGLCRMLLAARRAWQDCWHAKPAPDAGPEEWRKWRTERLAARADDMHDAWVGVRDWGREETLILARWSDGEMTSEERFAGARCVMPRLLSWSYEGVQFRYEFRPNNASTLELI